MEAVMSEPYYFWMTWIKAVIGRAPAPDQGIHRAKRCEECDILFEPRPSGCPDVLSEGLCRNCNSELMRLSNELPS
jgi:hypothetical protein